MAERGSGGPEGVRAEGEEEERSRGRTGGDGGRGLEG